MRDGAVVLAILGGFIEILVVVSEPPGALSPTIPTDQVRFWLGIAMGVVAIGAGVMVAARRRPRRWGVLLIASAVAGAIAVGAFYLLSAVIVAASGAMAMLVREPRRRVG